MTGDCDRGGERGGALMETLVALAITGLLAAAVAQTAGFGLTVVERASAASAEGVDALIRRREATATFARIDAGPGAFVGDASAVIWRGAAPGEDGGWRRGVWRWTAADGALSRCADMSGDACGEARDFGPPGGALAYAGRDGAWRDDWPGGPPPRLIRIAGIAGAAGDFIVVSPRLLGAAR